MWNAWGNECNACIMHRGCIIGECNMTEKDGCVDDGLNVPPWVWGICLWSDNVFTTVIPLCIIIISHVRPHCLHACTTRPSSALSDPSQRSSLKNLKGFYKSNLRGNENTESFFFFFTPPLNKTGGQRKKKILQQKWGNSTNYHLSESNPVTLAKNMQWCKHGNRRLIWV